MPDDVAIEARIPAQLNDALARLASALGKSKSDLVREVLMEYLLGETEYVLSEDEFAASVEEGRAAVRAGDVVDHEEVMREIDELLAQKK